MALASLSKSLLSRMSISGPSVSDLATPPSPSPSSAGSGPTPSSPLSVVGGNSRRQSTDSASWAGQKDGSVQSSGFSPIRNMELHPPRAKVIEDGSEWVECPVPLLCGESVEYMCCLQCEGDLLYLTNCRLIATQQTGFYSVPLRLIEGIEMQAVKETLTFLCRDCRNFRLVFPSPFLARSFLTHVQPSLQPTSDLTTLFAFAHRAARKDLKMEGVWQWGGVKRDGGSRSSKDPLISLNGPVHDDVMTSEYCRLGMAVGGYHGDRVWRLSQCNNKYQLCSTYPKLVVVPRAVSDEDLAQGAKFRMMGRIPVVVWRHPGNGCVILRASQPLVGVLSWRSSEDEKLLQAVSHACWESRSASMMTPYQVEIDQNGRCHEASNGTVPHKPHELLHSAVGVTGWEEEEESGGAGQGVAPRLVVMDLRSYTATLGNRAKGGGSECTDYYPNCEVQFKGLPNIHSVRKSFQQLRATLNSDDQSSFLSNLESTQWLSYLCQLVGVACEVVGLVHDSSLPVLIHCSDGWDRTTQIVALAELMLDPYYRTIEGFQVLVEREWLAFGHKFGDRCGHMGEDTNQRSPVFLQWLDCVHQLLRQFPCDFQFNHFFLMKLGQHAYSCLFGTLLGNSAKEREAWRVQEDTESIWRLLHEGNNDVINYLYQSPGKRELKVLRPVASIQSMLLWKEMYSTPVLSLYHTPSPPATPISLGEEHDNATTIIPNTKESQKLSKQPQSEGRTLESVTKPSTNATRTQADASMDANAKPDILIDAVQLQAKAEQSTVTPEVLSEARGHLDEYKEPESEDNDTTPTADNPLPNHGSSSPPFTMIDHGASTSPGGKNPVSSDGNATPLQGTEHAIHTAVSVSTAKGAKGTQEEGVVKEVWLSESGNLSSSSHESLHENLHARHNSSNCLPRSSSAQGESLNHGEEESSLIMLSASNSLSRSTDEDYLTMSPMPRPPSSSMEMLPMQGPRSEGQGSREEAWLEEGLREAMGVDSSDEAGRKSSTGHPSFTRFSMDVDGLPRCSDSVLVQLRRMQDKHAAQITALHSKLKLAQEKVCRLGCECGEVVGRLEVGPSSQQQNEDNAAESPSSLRSWDYVDESGEGVRWIPDHAVTHCYGCGKEFWTARRKHHCRSCGKVFCGVCSDFFCQVPHEQLFEAVRVCEKCFYKLDGHLQQQSSQGGGAPPNIT